MLLWKAWKVAHVLYCNTKNKLEGRHPEGSIRDPKKRMEKTSRRQRRMEASCGGGQGQEGAVAPQKVGWMDSYRNVCSRLPTYITYTSQKCEGHNCTATEARNLAQRMLCSFGERGPACTLWRFGKGWLLQKCVTVWCLHNVSIAQQSG